MAKAMSDVFDQQVIAMLPVESWTLTDDDLTTALAPLVGVEGARADDVEADGDAGAAFGDMPVGDTDLVRTLKVEDTAAAWSMVSEVGRLAGL